MKHPNEVQKLHDENKKLQNNKKDLLVENNSLLSDKKELLDDKRGLLSDKKELQDENEALREQVGDLQTTLNDFIDTNQPEAETEASTTVEMNHLAPSQQVSIAITASETIEEVRQMLEDHPDATEHLHQVVQTDCEEHVTTMADVKQNKEERHRAKQAERIQYPLHKQIRSKLPNRFSGISLPTEDIPAPEDISGPHKYEDLHPAVKDPSAAKHRAEGGILTSDYLLEAEEAADTAVDTAETGEELCENLRDTPGAHEDLLYAITTPNAHHAHETEPENANEQTPTQQREQSTERGHNNDRADDDQGPSL